MAEQSYKNFLYRPRRTEKELSIMFHRWVIEAIDASEIGRELELTKNQVIGSCYKREWKKGDFENSKNIPDYKSIMEKEKQRKEPKPDGVYCGEKRCKKTRQPGRGWCHEHIREFRVKKNRREKHVDRGIGGYASSVETSSTPMLRGWQ